MLPNWYIPPHLRTTPKHSAQRYMVATALEFNLTTADLRSKSRNANISFARHCAWHLIRKNRPDLSYPVIARISNRKDHSTVIHGCKRIEHLAKKQPELRERLDRIEWIARQSAQ